MQHACRLLEFYLTQYMDCCCTKIFHHHGKFVSLKAWGCKYSVRVNNRTRLQLILIFFLIKKKKHSFYKIQDGLHQNKRAMKKAIQSSNQIANMKGEGNNTNKDTSRMVKGYSKLMKARQNRKMFN